MLDSQNGYFEIDLRLEKPSATPRKAEKSNPTFSVQPELHETKKPLLSPARAEHGTSNATCLMNADVLIRNNEMNLAAHLIRQVLHRDSFHPEALKRLLKTIDEKNFSEREKILNALLKKDFNFENLVELGHCYYYQGQDALATSTYHKALGVVTEADHGLFEVHKNLGNLACKIGDFDAAEESFHKAFELNSQSDTLQINLGTLAIQKSDFNLALEKFRQALELNPNNDKAWVGLAMVHNQMGDFVLALANLENAIELNPGNRTAVHVFAQWSLRDQCTDAAIPYLEEYLATVECDEEISLILIHFHCLKSRWVEAQFEVERVLLWNPKSIEMQKVEKEIRVAIEGN